jgi:hypothetical protein
MKKYTLEYLLSDDGQIEIVKSIQTYDKESQKAKMELLVKMMSGKGL